MILLAVDMERAGLNTLLGIGIVFIALIFISLIIASFKLFNRPAPTPAAPVKDIPAAPEPEAEEEVSTDDTELVAVIMAAIEAYEEANGSSIPVEGLFIRSIRKINKKSWQNA